MSMRYFTLSAVCMLIFCMLLALSGTTDFPGEYRGMVSPPGASATHSGETQLGEKKSAASAALVPIDYGPAARRDRIEEAERGKIAGSRSLLYLGILLVAVWVLLSFRLLSNSKN